jgi:hypothetical protein
MAFLKDPIKEDTNESFSSQNQTNSPTKVTHQSSGETDEKNIHVESRSNQNRADPKLMRESS